MRYIRSSSFDSRAEGTDQGARKKSITFSECRLSSRSPSKSPSKDRGSGTGRLGSPLPGKKKTLYVKIHVPIPNVQLGVGPLVRSVAVLVNSIHKNQVLHLVPLVVHRPKVTMGPVLLPRLLMEVTKGQVVSVLGNTFSNLLSSM